MHPSAVVFFSHPFDRFEGGQSTAGFFHGDVTARYTSVMSTYRSLSDADLDGKKVLLRAGFDVPMENGVVTDASRIDAALPTMKFILSKGASLIIMAHQDRPKGKIVPAMSQRPLVDILERKLGRDVAFAASCVGEETKRKVDALAPGEVLLLENLRFDAREEGNDADFARELASYADAYVNEAFPNCHREHASMVGAPTFLPAYPGLQLEKEILHLSAAIEHPKLPLTFIVSGVKIETKLPVIDRFLEKGADILVGGAIANTLMAAAGHDVGSSLHESDRIKEAADILKRGGAKVRMPIDVIVAPDAQSPAVRTTLPKDIGTDAVFDLGPETMSEYASIVQRSRTVVWNGPLGMSERAEFAGASKRMATELAAITKTGATTIVGGGDTLDFLAREKIDPSSYTFVSTGGGAMLDYLAGNPMPAIDALKIDR